MEDQKPKICRGLLLIRTKSGTTKLEKVLVQARKGKGENQVECRFRNYVEEKRKPSRIPVFVRNYRRGIKSKKIVKSLPSSDGEKEKPSCEKSEDFKIKNYENLIAKEKEKLMSIINLDDFRSELERVHNKYFQKHNEDSGVISLSQTNASEKGSLSSDLHQFNRPACNPDEKISEKSKVASLSEETESSSEKKLQTEVSEDISADTSKQSSSKNESRFFTDTSRNTTSSSAILAEDVKSSQNEVSTTDESSKVFVIKKNVIFAENLNCIFQFTDSDTHLQRQRTSIVMTQYDSTTPNSLPAIEAANDEKKESEESVVEEIHRFIDSGLRPLKSDESRLFLHPESHQSTKHHTTSEEEDVNPLLEDIPSEIFEKWEPIRKKKKEKPKEDVSEPSAPSHKGDFTSSEDKSITSQPSNQIDTGPLKKLQEFEDVKFTIETEDLPEEKEEKIEVEEEEKVEEEEQIKAEDLEEKEGTEEEGEGGEVEEAQEGAEEEADEEVEEEEESKTDEKEEEGGEEAKEEQEAEMVKEEIKEKREDKCEDFCVHVKDVPDGDFSSSTIDDSKSTTSINKFRLRDICFHTVDVPGKDFSTSASDESKSSTDLKKNVTVKPETGFSPNTDDTDDADVEIMEKKIERRDVQAITMARIKKMDQVYEATNIDSVKSTSTSYSTPPESPYPKRLDSIVLETMKQRRLQKVKRKT